MIRSVGLACGAALFVAACNGGSFEAAPELGGSSKSLRFAGDPIQPWTCTTLENGLGVPVDDQCNAAAPVVTYKYKDAVTGQIQDYDPAHPPASALIASTTTDQGRTVPFVIRYERGTLNRSIYYIAVLADAADLSAPAGAWNHKLLVPFGGSCSATHSQKAPGAIEVSKAAPDGAVLLDLPLSRGYAVATTGLSVLGQNCNPVVSAEVLLALKQHLIRHYGAIRYTIGEGCSGGSVQQHTIADNYPGLLDGLIPSCSFPDLWSPLTEVFDCSLLESYFDTISPALWLDPVARIAVSGSAAGTTCLGWIATFKDALNPSNNKLPPTACDVSDADIYQPSSHPDGVRCTVQDYGVAVWGRRAADGFARRPLDNVGVQYGLEALAAGTIGAEQFVDLNEKIGGFDIDLNHQASRSAADEGAVAIAYRAGMITTMRQAADVPIIDLRGTGNAEVHTDFWSYATRARLQAANGSADNQVIWTSAVDNFLTIGFDTVVAPEAFLTMDAWLAAIEADGRPFKLAHKVTANKPAAAVDACFVGSTKITDPLTCASVYPYFANPRIAAGGPLASDVIKCQLKPLVRADYATAFSDAQWTRLQNAFSGGVCDFSRPAADRDTQLVWPSFSNGPGADAIPNPPSS